jgi:hypothetical protein
MSRLGCFREGQRNVAPDHVIVRTPPMPDKYKHMRAERNAMLRQLKNIIELKDEREFMTFLRVDGIKDENPRFSRPVKAFRDGKVDEVLEKKT